MVWLIALTSTGIGSLWLVAKHWYGWPLYLLNEALWFIYGITLHALPLIVMAVLWFAVGVRNLFVSYKDQHQGVNA